jgi:hypothetical protein
MRPNGTGRHGEQTPVTAEPYRLTTFQGETPSFLPIVSVLQMPQVLVRCGTWRGTSLDHAQVAPKIELGETGGILRPSVPAMLC